MTFLTGIDNLIRNLDQHSELRTARVGLVANPASVDGQLQHSADALMSAGVNITRAFGPQHGMRGEPQDNMIETEDYFDPSWGIPVMSLYGEHRRPTPAMLADLDIVLFDLQDIGCRIYTYISTLRYFLEEASAAGVALWVLDRPNPAGRPVDGLRLEPGQESFVGCDILPTRHGLTTGELARWFVSRAELDIDLKVIEMSGYFPGQAPGYGWPLQQRSWVNPSPNASSLNMARCFPGTVLLEGTTLSEGRGTTVPLEVIGAPGLPFGDYLELLRGAAPGWCDGALIRPCYFQPTFHKHIGEVCGGLQFHTDNSLYEHQVFRPFRLIAGLLKVLRQQRPDFDLWRYHEYEYELDRIPIDVINGGPALRTWVDDPSAGFAELDARLDAELATWLEERVPFLIYP